MTLHFCLAEETHLQSYMQLLPSISADPNSGAHQYPDLATCKSIFAEIVHSQHMHLILGCDEAAQVLAACVLLVTPNLSYVGKPWGIIEHVVVSPSLRGSGVGTKLITWANDFAKDQGCYKTQLISGAEENQIHFYKKLGFKNQDLIGFKKYL